MALDLRQDLRAGACVDCITSFLSGVEGNEGGVQAGNFLITTDGVPVLVNLRLLDPAYYRLLNVEQLIYQFDG